MAPYYGPDEDPNTIMLERMFLAGDFISGVGYGVQLMLYVLCSRYLWNTRRERRLSVYLLAYITLLLCIETIFEVAQSNTVQMIYIDNRNYPGGPWAYFLATQDLPINVLFIASLFSITFLADLLVLWRCWVIWRAFGKLGAYLAIAFPSLLLLASFIMGTFWTLQSSQPGLSLYSALPLAYGTSYLAISLGVNIILTILITARLLVYRRSVMETLPEDHAREYVSLVTIIIESASLYSVFALIFLVTYAANQPVNSVFLTVASFTQQIANYLIIYRLAQGRAWHKNTLAQTNTAMEFTANRHTHTTGNTGVATIDLESADVQESRQEKESKVYASLAATSSSGSSNTTYS
ncbi:hypothetical protein D9615_001082 [Tricholomella constricta]|uniref:Uncharacterized protein n=1 Tax=Tricholomella constricta TaxID=117010 RepID=A0A8H5HKS0_9AGAR|nr:hypothetical protein D9615_001082 [Tricholomella constricta]